MANEKWSEQPVLTGATETTMICAINGYGASPTNNLISPVDLGLATSDSPTFTGQVILPSTTTIGGVSSNEINYLTGVTSNIQTQIGLKAPKEYPTFSKEFRFESSVPIGNENGDMLFQVYDMNHGGSISVNDYSYLFVWNKSFFDVAPVLNNLETFEDNTAAAALATGTVYKTSTGVLMVKY